MLPFSGMFFGVRKIGMRNQLYTAQHTEYFPPSYKFKIRSHVRLMVSESTTGTRTDITKHYYIDLRYRYMEDFNDSYFNCSK